MLEHLIQKLKKFDKIIVTGSPRSGTTITGLIVASELGYKFIDESWYDGNDSRKFIALFTLPRKMVIHTTAFLRDLHTIPEFFDINNATILLVKRDIKDILASFENSKNFTEGVQPHDGLFTQFDDEALGVILKHYGSKNGCVPEVIYDHFYKHNEIFFEIDYKDLKDHKLFVQKEERRENFQHLKQVKVNDPNYLYNRKGVMVL